MIKKLIAALAATAMTVSAFAGIAFADKTYDLRLDSGATAYNANYDRQYFSVWCDDLAGEYTSSIQIQVKVTKGELDAESCKISKGSASKGGVYIPADPEDDESEDEYLSANAWTFNVMDEADGTQSVRISWGSSTPVTTANGKLVELYVVPTTEGDIEFELGSASLTNVVNTCTANNSNKVDHMFTPTTPLQYVLADATSTITEKSAATATPEATATPVVTEAPTAEPTAEPTATPDPAAATVSELQESDADDKNAAGYDYAKAIYKSFAGNELVGKRVAWTINGKTAAFDYAIADVDGDVVVGLVIMDTVADALNAITAATAAIVD